MKDGREDPAFNIYSVEYVPHFVVVGKDGIIRFLGYSNKIEE